MALGRHLGVSYNTAWLLKQKLMQALLLNKDEGTIRSSTFGV